MKKLMTILGAAVFTLFVLTSCGGSSKKEGQTKSKETTETTKSKAVTEGDSDCDKLLKEYEEITIKGIEIVKKMKADPTNTAISEEFEKLGSKAMDMAGKIENCTDEKSMKKLEELSKKMEEAL